MPKDEKNYDKDFNDIIRKILEQAIKNGNFPINRKYSITIADGELPIEMVPSNCDGYKKNVLNSGKQNIILNNPHTEIHKSGEKILIYANIPGLDISSTAISVHNDLLCITSFTDRIKHTAEVKIPPVKKETIKYKSNNGVLEISVKTAE